MNPERRLWAIRAILSLLSTVASFLVVFVRYDITVMPPIKIILITCGVLSFIMFLLASMQFILTYKE